MDNLKSHSSHSFWKGQTHTQRRSIPISGCTLKTLSVNKRHILHVDLTKAKSDSQRSKLPQQFNQKTHYHHHQHLFISVTLPQNGSEQKNQAPPLWKAPGSKPTSRYLGTPSAALAALAGISPNGHRSQRVIVQLAAFAIFEYLNTKGCPKILLVDHHFHPIFHGLSSDSSMYHWLIITGYLGSQMTTLDKPTVATSSHRDPKRTNICKIHEDTEDTSSLEHPWNPMIDRSSNLICMNSCPSLPAFPHVPILKATD